MRPTRFLSVFIVFSVILCSCNKYKGYQSQYHLPPGAPDYSKLETWAAHPWKWDPADSIPAPLRNEPRDTAVDVFFLHPTTYTSMKKMKGDYAELDDAYTDAKTDYSTIMYQASVFNQHARIFAPRYRQAHISMFYATDKIRAAAAFNVAYEDLKTAFIYYLKNWNNHRPFIIASHSQGSFLAERLLKELFENPQSEWYSYRNNLVVAYILGWPVKKDQFSEIKMCSDSLQTGCICSWRTMRKNYIPPYMRDEHGSAMATNPLNWKTTDDYAGKELNEGSVLTKFNTIYPHTTDAQIHDGMLWVKKPKFPLSFLYRSKNYHIADINLYYINLRKNVEQRIGAWKKGH